jgi:hypothetical protein
MFKFDESENSSYRMKETENVCFILKNILEEKIFDKLD